MLDRTLTVRVARIDALTPEIRAFELVHPWGRALPGWAAGAHIDLHTPGGFMRQYSLASAPPAGGAPMRYLIGVKREPVSRGGSLALHEQVAEGDLLAISAPRNTFPLHRQARHHLLLAGGIGLTPLLAMAEQLSREGAAFTLAVFARSRSHLPFAEPLAALGARVRLHLDDPAAPEKLDLARLIGESPEGSHLYLCGPGGFMQAARTAAAHWRDDSVHLEYFAPPSSGADDAPSEPFVLRLAQRGISVPVAAGQSAVEALHDLGIGVPTSCEQGVCGTCVVPWLARPGSGAPEHRDFCLSATERQRRVALCCARATSGTLTIDL